MKWESSEHENDIHTTVFKCIRWQVEETLDPISCPYHYFCGSTYPGNYPPAADLLLLFSTISSYFATLVLTVLEISNQRAARSSPPPPYYYYSLQNIIRRYLLPSGPVFLPVFLLALAKGHRINTSFPLTCNGPAILQLLLISALAFDNQVDQYFKYAFLVASKISGLVHASMYLDFIILPYYTGYDALETSVFSGECPSCICRQEALIAGGKLVNYRGWSKTTFSVVGALCLRIITRLLTENNNNSNNNNNINDSNNKGKAELVKSILESLGWILITKDCAYLVRNLPPERFLWRSAVFAALLLMISLHVLGKACAKVTRLQSRFKNSNYC